MLKSNETPEQVDGRPQTTGDGRPKTEQTSPATSTTEPAEKRLVLEYVNGPLKGLFQIIDAVTQFPTHMQGPFTVGSEDGHVVEFASLIKVQARWVHYREVADRSSFSGRLGDYLPGTDRVGDFDPAQV